jgi:hypothetical protein
MLQNPSHCRFVGSWSSDSSATSICAEARRAASGGQPSIKPMLAGKARELVMIRCWVIASAGRRSVLYPKLEILGME